MIQWVTRLFGSEKNTNKIVETAADGIYHGIDKLIYTDEERAEAMAEGRKAFLEFVRLTHDQNSIRSVTRRWLAFMVVAPAMLSIVSATLMFVLAAFSPSAQGVLTVAGNHLSAMGMGLAPWTGGVLAFYFGPHIIGAYARTKTGGQ
jgi:hypothetical protein